MNDRSERRRALLSDDDIARIEQAFDKRLNGLFEVIGYDTSTPSTREEIRKDHEFVRGTRKAKGRIVGAFLTSLGAAVAGFLWSAFNIGKN